jgi:hypothetical protein
MMGYSGFKREIHCCDLEIMLIFFRCISTFPLCRNWLSEIARTPKAELKQNFLLDADDQGDSFFNTWLSASSKSTLISVLGGGGGACRAVFFSVYDPVMKVTWVSASTIWSTGSISEVDSWHCSSAFQLNPPPPFFFATLNISVFQYIVRLASKTFCHIFLFIT